jgi:integrase
MTATLNFDSVPQVRKAVKDKPTSGTKWYKHEDRKYECLYLGVGKRAATWYFKGRLNGKSRQKSLEATFPETTAATAFAKIDALTAHHGSETTSEIKTVRDAWKEYRVGATAKQSTLDDQESKLERFAEAILNKSPTAVKLLDVRRCLLAIPSVSTRHHVKSAINNAYSILDIRSPITRGKLKAKQLGKVRKRPTFWKELCDSDPDIDRRDWSPMWEAIMAVKNPLRRTAWIVMFFTGIRSDDVRSLRWDQIDLARKTIRLDDMKNGETRTLPICDTVVAALSAIRSNYAFVFPTTSTKTGETIYIDHLDTLMHPTLQEDTGKLDKKGNLILKPIPVLRQHDTRHHFTSACGPARVPSYAAAFLRGDITSDNRDDDMVMEYQEDLDLHDLVMDIEKVIIDRIKVTPAFEVAVTD